MIYIKFSIRSLLIIIVLTGLVFSYSCNNNSDSYKIPFKIIKNNIIIKVIPNESYISNFIFDTGSEPTYIDSSLAVKLKLEPITAIYTICNIGEKLMEITKCNFKIDRLELLNDTTLIAPFDSVSKYVGIKINGIIGKNIFKNHFIKIDFINNVIEIFKSNEGLNLKDYQAFKSYRGLAIIAEIVLKNGGKKGKYIIDTGSPINTTIELPYTLDSSIIRSMIGSFKTDYLMDLCGFKKQVYIGKISCLQMGNLKLDSLSVLLSNTIQNQDTLGRHEYQGLIGLPTLKYFDIIIDNINSKIYLKPNAFYIKAKGLKKI